MTIWRMRIACWIPKSTNTHLRICNIYVFPLQQCLHERTSILRHTYSVRLVASDLGSISLRACGVLTS